MPAPDEPREHWAGAAGVCLGNGSGRPQPTVTGRPSLVPSGSPTFGVGSADNEACDVRDHVSAVVSGGEDHERPVPVGKDPEMCLPAPVGAVVPEPPCLVAQALDLQPEAILPVRG